MCRWHARVVLQVSEGLYAYAGDGIPPHAVSRPLQEERVKSPSSNTSRKATSTLTRRFYPARASRYQCRIQTHSLLGRTVDHAISRPLQGGMGKAPLEEIELLNFEIELELSETTGLN